MVPVADTLVDETGRAGVARMCYCITLAFEFVTIFCIVYLITAFIMKNMINSYAKEIPVRL